MNAEQLRKWRELQNVAAKNAEGKKNFLELKKAFSEFLGCLGLDANDKTHKEFLAETLILRLDPILMATHVAHGCVSTEMKALKISLGLIVNSPSQNRGLKM